MKKLFTVILVILLVIGLFTVGAFAIQESIDVNFNYPYGGWTFYDSNADVWWLFIGYEVESGYSPYAAYTTLLVNYGETGAYSKIRTQAADGSEDSKTGIFVDQYSMIFSGRAHGPLYVNPVYNYHTGYRAQVSMYYQCTTY